MAGLLEETKGVPDPGTRSERSALPAQTDTSVSLTASARPPAVNKISIQQQIALAASSGAEESEPYIQWQRDNNIPPVIIPPRIQDEYGREESSTAAQQTVHLLRVHYLNAPEDLKELTIKLSSKGTGPSTEASGGAGLSLKIPNLVKFKTIDSHKRTVDMTATPEESISFYLADRELAIFSNGIQPYFVNYGESSGKIRILQRFGSLEIRTSEKDILGTSSTVDLGALVFDFHNAAGENSIGKKTILLPPSFDAVMYELNLLEPVVLDVTVTHYRKEHMGYRNKIPGTELIDVENFSRLSLRDYRNPNRRVCDVLDKNRAIITKYALAFAEQKQAHNPLFAADIPWRDLQHVKAAIKEITNLLKKKDQEAFEQMHRRDSIPDYR